VKADKAKSELTVSDRCLLGMARILDAGGPGMRPSDMTLREKNAWKLITSIVDELPEESAAKVLLAVTLMFGVRIQEKEAEP
jgi:hypothetical protein